MPSFPSLYWFHFWIVSNINHFTFTYRIISITTLLSGQKSEAGTFWTGGSQGDTKVPGTRIEKSNKRQIGRVEYRFQDGSNVKTWRNLRLENGHSQKNHPGNGPKGFGRGDGHFLSVLSIGGRGSGTTQAGAMLFTRN